MRTRILKVSFSAAQLCGFLVFAALVFAGLLLSFPCVAKADRPLTVSPAAKLDPQQTHALIVGVLSWQEQSLAKYPKQNRQDLALSRQLQQLGVPPQNITVLLDDDATRGAIIDATQTLLQRTTSRSTLIVYYAGHGMTDGGEGIFACYDIQTRAMKRTGWRLSDLESAIKDNFRGKQVLLFADCCFSGKLADTAEHLAAAGFQTASLTSASASNTSTNNWTFTVSMIESLRGAAIVDTNRDGVVTIGEAATEVRDSMRFYEQQRHGFSLHNVSPSFQLAKTTTNNADATPTASQTKPAFTRGRFLQARIADQWQTVRILETRENEVQVEYQQYSQRPQQWIKRDRVREFPEAKQKRIPPIPLADDLALQKASAGGKYSKLLIKFAVAQDFAQYGAFHEFGLWDGKSYADKKDLPQGYWVYVYPNWYIWKNENQVPSKIKRDLSGTGASRPVFQKPE